MGYDSRRWTGQYAPGDRPAALGEPQPGRRRYMRWLLAFMVVAWLAVAIGYVLFARPEPGADALTLSMLASGLGTAFGSSPFARSRWRDYDEFERVVLMQAHRRAYFAIVTVMMIAFAWCAAASHHGWPMPHRPFDWLIWAVALLAIATNLPALFAEWAIPFPDSEDAA